jgi:hypothetical protein
MPGEFSARKSLPVLEKTPQFSLPQPKQFCKLARIEVFL